MNSDNAFLMAFIGPFPTGWPAYFLPNFWHKNLVDKMAKMLFLIPLSGMKTTFAKQLKLQMIANGHRMAVWTRVSCLIGNVGMKF